ncbi:MAG: hypothetical protein Q9208_003662 [Pyrenodesmia sp. 3 TL-2023]
MSTITSPRQSIASLSPDPSRRSSLDTVTRSQATSPARPARRNKTALRDYYNLKASTTTTTNAQQSPQQQQQQQQNPQKQQQRREEGPPELHQSELDAPGFDAESYVRGVLERESLQGLLRIESGLVGEIRGLDGEKKALVYDNYSKLIAATETIRKMRTHMDPLIPTTSTLSPAIAHIAETAASLAESLQSGSGHADDGEEEEDDDAVRKQRQRQRDTVRWVLAAPGRLKGLLDGGRRAEAEGDWAEVKTLLEKWEGVEGADEVREVCLRVMMGEEVVKDAG